MNVGQQVSLAFNVKALKPWRIYWIRPIARCNPLTVVSALRRIGGRLLLT